MMGSAPVTHSHCARTESVWNKAALQRYILCAAQHPAAGLRDKPPKYGSLSPYPVRISAHDALLIAERAGARTRIIRCIVSPDSQLLSTASTLYRRDVPRSIRRGRRLRVTSHVSRFDSDAQRWGRFTARATSQNLVRGRTCMVRRGGGVAYSWRRGEPCGTLPPTSLHASILKRSLRTPLTQCST